MDRCDECRFDDDDAARADLGDRLRDLAARHAERLTETPAAYLRQRPQAGTWSALEYGCHVRDVLMVQRERIVTAQVEDRPEFAPMGRDERAVQARYNDQDPSTVARVLEAAAAGLATLLESLADAGWARSSVYPYPHRELRDVDWIARHTLHELSHHLTDVDRVLQAVLDPGARSP